MPKVLSLALLFVTSVVFARVDTDALYLVRAKAKDKAERSKIAELGFAIDGIYADSVTFITTESQIRNLQGKGISFTKTLMPERPLEDFPKKDSAFHNYAELQQAIAKMVNAEPDLVQRHVIGKSWENRELVAIRLSGNPKVDSLPTTILTGCHHAREHLSVEIPLMMAQYLVKNYSKDKKVKDLLDTREVWIVPMVNPDGAEHDIEGGKYKMWRKNRRDNGDRSYGVDLNRNYGAYWGGKGSSGSTGSDTYRGPKAFSEPESQAVRDFVKSRKRATVQINFHTFSELVLWPWGHSDDPISNKKDREVFETMGKKMATWNGYKPMQASGLYVASGITSDWAYDSQKIFSFTFELSPKSIWSGGFYPGAKAIQPTFDANVDAMLYLIEKSADPYGVLEKKEVDPLGVL